MDIWGDLMSEVKHSEIIYEEGWRESAPAVKQETPAQPPDQADAEGFGQQSEETRNSRPLLITLQLILCLLAALVLFLLKAMDSEGYRDFIEFYHEELQKPLVSQEVFSSADIGRLFSTDTVTVQATPDEAADSGS